MPEQQREIGAILARLETVERESQRQRERLHDLESVVASVKMLLDQIRELREMCSEVPIIKRDVGALAGQVKTNNRGFWALVLALFTAAIAFAFFAIQLATT